jgi:acyl-coenzyme A synthetase/AMP-(fatty) acid ligase
MTPSTVLVNGLGRFGDGAALLFEGRATSYRALAARVEAWVAELDRLEVAPGAAVAVGADFTPEPCALLLALMASGRVAVPFSDPAPDQGRLEHAQVSAIFTFAGDRLVETQRRPQVVPHALYQTLRARGAPGLVLFTSGSSGRPKAPLLDLDRLLDRPSALRPARRTVAFLLFDHIGGLNTLFHALGSGDTVVTVPERSPEVVCAAIARHRAQLLPTTPTFLRMLLMAGAHQRHDLSSLELVTYGAEPMPASTLAQIGAALPGLRLKQTYGMSEIGILPTKSRDSGSLWLKAGGPGYETKLAGGRLFVRAAGAMLGYLGEPSPFDAEGWLDTGDAVETDGDWIRILGRSTECINVGGQKVHPAEVESVLLELDNIEDVLVRARPNPVTGQVVAATVRLRAQEDLDGLRRRLRQFCRERLAPYKIPASVEIAETPLHGARFKKERAEKAW